MGGKIFVNYRRDDDKNFAARVHKHLCDEFGADNVFLDVDQLKPGERFEEVLTTALASTKVLLVLIGPRWMELLRARMAEGSMDYARKEIAQALAQRIKVIPVLADQTQLPVKDELPEDIRELVAHHKHTILFEHFGQSMTALLDAIQPRTMRRKPLAGVSWRRMAVAALSLLGVAVAVLAVDKVAPEWIEAVRGNVGLGNSIVTTEKNPVIGSMPLPAENMPLVQVKPGRFAMGSPVGEPHRTQAEGVRRMVEIQLPLFSVAAHAVTRGQYSQFVTETSRSNSNAQCTYWMGTLRLGKWQSSSGVDWKSPGFQQDDNHPVVCVSYLDAIAFAEWLSSKTGRRYRLPTEAQREYFTRAGTTGSYSTGETITGAQANYQFDRGGTVVVNTFDANPWGLKNTHGNVWEWVEDCWSEGYNGAPSDGTSLKRDKCDARVVRGGSFADHYNILRSAHREFRDPVNRYYNVGFRLVRILP